jgi:hypothetical protein
MEFENKIINENSIDQLKINSVFVTFEYSQDCNKIVA